MSHAQPLGQRNDRHIRQVNTAWCEVGTDALQEDPVRLFPDSGSSQRGVNLDVLAGALGVLHDVGLAVAEVAETPEGG